ncbi:hypothetical protein HRR83_002259 [Exophiala dermatitidis]|uniref:Oxidoreductase, zinc-binding dehydrogenase n=2 Tax=Exophiala dermatitidis TaxID=5970 RepID=H6BY89_EXODN|nr:oxidoreductase, zinc-binding dehydrogenase [Exophiala dermatitidis NIH/UT8656]KAJ4520280.1 hypothetical protein HRR75_002145 [Exophiala dermatitidis]EHY56657.1 oxidoreductase, zinc-binding dehydrogenase [Exophiala dermatitidis NIH/UT8656]KAJ4524139.1 hypothetical protein HRR74_002336 [Exophiala dermatitidis]KAJ4525589.1 hypothetical protein HRR73_002319 [Exophiala dermatitidis]KAJ4536907.1 hypothetical protein HRR76_004932 [Exophiala dermatitidis]
MGFLHLFSSLGISSPPKELGVPILCQDPEKVPARPSKVAPHQRVLLLRGPRQPYEEVSDHPTPSLDGNREFLVRNLVIGLNPIDWKAPDFNFGIPELPYISGRELVGEVAITPKRKSRFRPGDKVIVISTDYRDLRKAAYQEYVVATDFNAARLPPRVSPEAGSALGVAFVAAALCLGICAGLDFSSIANGPDLLSLVRGIDPERLPEDIRAECSNGIDRESRAKEGDWLAIWGGSSTSAYMINQIARLAGLRTISVVDVRKHAVKLSANDITRPDIVVDNHDPHRAIEIVRSATGKRLRFAVDTVGRETATHLLECLQQHYANEDDPPSATESTPQPAHLIGLTGLPKSSPPSNVTFHNVPIKLFHEVPEVGESMMLWLERLLATGLLVPPNILGVEEGFSSVNRALDSMRRGEVSGGRLVVKIP